MGLTAYEYQCGHGVRTGEEAARAIGAKAAEHGIAVSLHAPYYISLASADPEKRENSVRYILQSARAADWLGGERIVVHPGGLGGLSRRLLPEKPSAARRPRWMKRDSPTSISARRRWGRSTSSAIWTKCFFSAG